MLIDFSKMVLGGSVSVLDWNAGVSFSCTKSSEVITARQMEAKAMAIKLEQYYISVLPERA